MHVNGSYPPCRFVVLAAPRTGSNWLCTLLDSHPRVLCHHELFNPDGIHLSRRLAARREPESLELGTLEERARAPAALLDRTWRAHLGHQCVGFKLNLGQDPRAFDQVLSDPAARKIVLRRRNRVRTFVSEAIAQRTGDWESYREVPLRPEPPRLTVAAADLRAHAERNRAYYAALERRLVAAGRPWIEVAYERLEQSAERERILAFLGVPSAPLVAGTLRRHPQPLRELIANFEELRAELRGSDLEGELCEDR